MTKGDRLLLWRMPWEKTWAREFTIDKVTDYGLVYIIEDNCSIPWEHVKHIARQYVEVKIIKAQSR